MCPPEHFGVLYEINPWMHREVGVDLDAARQEWESLVATLRSAGAQIELLDPQPDLPDLCSRPTPARSMARRSCRRASGTQSGAPRSPLRRLVRTPGLL